VGGAAALKRSGIKIKAYYASEVDKYAITIAQKNHPEIVQIGDVRKLRYKDGVLYTENGKFEVGIIDLVIGGSPCQNLSFVGSQQGLRCDNLDQYLHLKKIGYDFGNEQSYLFWEYIRVVREIDPFYVFLENVKMKSEWVELISREMECDEILVNSSLVSGQNRERNYWTNARITAPKDKGILLRDILLPDVDQKLMLSENEIAYMDRATKDGRTHWDFGHHHDASKPKSHCIPANLFKGVPYNVLIDQYGRKRKLHPIEAERLQQLDDNYTEGVSWTQRYRSIGNGWSIDVIAHFFTEINEQLMNFKIKEAA